MSDGGPGQPVTPPQTGFLPDEVPEELKPSDIIIPPRAEDLTEPPELRRRRERQAIVRAAASTVAPTGLIFLTRLLVPLPWEYVTVFFAAFAFFSAFHLAGEVADEKRPAEARTLAAVVFGFLAVMVQWVGVKLQAEPYIAFALTLPPAGFAWLVVSQHRRLAARPGPGWEPLWMPLGLAAAGAVACAAYLSELPFGALILLLCLPSAGLAGLFCDKRKTPWSDCLLPLSQWLTFRLAEFDAPFWPKVPQVFRNLGWRWAAFQAAVFCHALAVALLLPLPDYQALLELKARFKTMSALVTHVLVWGLPLVLLLAYPAIALILTFGFFDEEGET